MSEPEHLRPEFEKFFRAEPRVFRAPGRINLIGEHVDYNDGLVMPAAIDLAAWVAASPRTDRKIVARSLEMEGEFTLDLDVQRPVASGDWSDYVYGVALELDKLGAQLTGANLLVAGDVPIGAGLSSSAALEVASALALADAAGMKLPPEEFARLCQSAESDFVGVSCGIMDQFASCCSRPGEAMLLDCRDLSVRFVTLPSSVRLVLANTMVQHDLTSGKYNKRRSECEQSVERLRRGRPEIRSLRDVTVEEIESARDVLTKTQLRRCRHVTTENQRVLDAEKALATGDVQWLGRLISASHQSLRDDYEVSCRELDVMAEIAEQTPGANGARMMGGGFGGCVLALVDEDYADEFGARVGPRYEDATGREPWFHVCTLSGGAGPVERVAEPAA